MGLRWPEVGQETLKVSEHAMQIQHDAKTLMEHNQDDKRSISHRRMSTMFQCISQSLYCSHKISGIPFTKTWDFRLQLFEGAYQLEFRYHGCFEALKVASSEESAAERVKVRVNYHRRRCSAGNDTERLFHQLKTPGPLYCRYRQPRPNFSTHIYALPFRKRRCSKSLP